MKYLILILIIFSGLLACTNKNEIDINNNSKQLDSIVSNVNTDISKINIFKTKKVEPLTYADIFNTKWNYSFDKENSDIYHFKSDTTYSFFSSELRENFFGEFKIVNDTIFIYQEQGEYDDEFAKNSRHRTKKEIYALEIINGKLKHLNKKTLVEGFWKKSDFKFEENYLFRKELK